MNLAFDIGQLVVGLALLYFGAEWLVTGAAGLARSFGIKPLVIGLTVVAYGTSSPELVVGISAGLRDQGAIALGNVVGSNVANMGLILAVCALVRPTLVDRQIVRRELPVLLFATACVPLALIDGTVSNVESGALVGIAVAYSVAMVLTSRRGSVEEAAHVESDAAASGLVPPSRTRAKLAGLTLLGLGLLVGGGHLLVEGAVGIARVAGMSDRIIGLTIVAIGTSLPELATSLVAAIRGHGEIAVGNVVGSNIFNVFLILGASGAVGSIDAPLRTVALDLGMLGGMTVFAAIAMTTRRKVGRFEGIVLLLGYVTFLSLLALA